MVIITYSTKVFCKIVPVNIFSKLLRRHLQSSPSLINLEDYNLLLHWRRIPLWKLFCDFGEIFQASYCAEDLLTFHLESITALQFSKSPNFLTENLEIRHFLLILRKKIEETAKWVLFLASYVCLIIYLREL